MSDADIRATSILLPAAKVAVYSRDQDTLDAARALDNDWRFARVELAVEEGDIKSAIEAYKEVHSPDLLIIQTDTIGDALTNDLGSLAQHCEEGTAAIIIGPDNDVALYRKLIDMGISDYLVKPIKTDMMADIIAKTLIEKLGATGSRLIAFAGAKGGVGTSAILQACAWGVSDILDQKTIIMDAAGGWSALSVGIGFEPATTLSEASRAAENSDEDGLKRMLHKAGDKLSILASGGDVMLERPINAVQAEHILDTLMAKFPVILADLSHTTPDVQKAILSRAHDIVVVSTPSLSSLRLARSLIHEIKEIRGGDEQGVELIINKAGLDKTTEVSKNDIQKAMDLNITSIIPYAPKVFMKAESESKKITQIAEGLEIVKASLIPFIASLLSVTEVSKKDDSEVKSGLLGGFFSKIKS